MRPPKHLNTLASIAWLAVLVACGPSAIAGSATETTWPVDTPESQGIDSRELAKIFEFVKAQNLAIHSLLVIRNGNKVLDARFYPYDGKGLHDVASVTKSITSTLVGLAIEQGKLTGVKQPVRTTMRMPQQLPSDSWIYGSTVSDVLTMRSGMNCGPDDEASNLRMRGSAHWAEELVARNASAAPGERFQYCSAGMHFLSAVLSTATSESAAQFAERNLFRPLGIDEYIWPYDPDGRNHGWGDLHLSPDSMARIGETFLHKGRWNERQIVSADWVRTATAPIVRAHGRYYGYGWWVDPSVAGGLFEAEGRGGQRISVLPNQNMTIIMTGGDFEPGDIGGFILNSVKSADPLPPNAGDDEALHALVLEAAAVRPLFSQDATPVDDEVKRQLAARHFDLPANQFGMKWVRFSFPSDHAARLEACFVDRSCQSVPIGLGGMQLTGHRGRFNLTTVAAGYGRGDQFVYSVDEVENITAYSAMVSVRNGKLRMIVNARGSTNRVVIESE